MAVALAFLIYVFAIYPIMQPVIDDFVANNPDADQPTVIMIQLLPFVVIFAIVFSIISFVAPFESPQRVPQ